MSAAKRFRVGFGGIIRRSGILQQSKNKVLFVALLLLSDFRYNYYITVIGFYAGKLSLFLYPLNGFVCPRLVLGVAGSGRRATTLRSLKACRLELRDYVLEKIE